jgi:hypothetical protein
LNYDESLELMSQHDDEQLVRSIAAGRRAALGTQARWQWQMQGALNLDIEADLFVVDLFGTSSDTIALLRDTGLNTVCCFSVGVQEQWTDDTEDFVPETIGNSVQTVQGENWVDITATSVREIMVQRMVLAQDKGCDGVAPDYMDGFVLE